MFRSESSKSGFTLTETMAAVMVLTLALFAVLSVNAYTLRASTANRNQQIANTIACTQLSIVETILKINFQAPPESINTQLLASSTHPGFTFQIVDLGFENPGRNLRGVAVRVFWEEKGAERYHDLATTFHNF